MIHTENRIAADDLRELGRSRLHKDVQNAAEKLAIFDELVDAMDDAKHFLMPSWGGTWKVYELIARARSIK